MILAVESSCDETAVAVLDPSAVNLSDSLKSNIISSQVEAHAPYGGVVPELAARKHITNLPVVVNESLKQAGVSFEDLTAVAVTRGPGLKVCLLVGITWARTLAFGLGVPLIAVNHLEGHLLAHELEPEGSEAVFPRLILLVSGGHTMLILSPSRGVYQTVAETQDDAAGEAFDKSAMLLGLGYPGGPALSKLAAEGDTSRFSFPIGMPNNDQKFSFSGMKTAVWREIENQDLSSEQIVKDLAAGVELAIVDALELKTRAALKKYSPKSLILAGGVAANGRLRQRFKCLGDEFDSRFYVARPAFCTDNAAMIAVAANYHYQKHKSEMECWKINAEQAGPGLELDFSPLNRWPLAAEA